MSYWNDSDINGFKIAIQQNTGQIQKDFQI